MGNWLAQNWGTLTVGAALALILAAVIWKMARDKKSGRGGCGCNCAGCPNAGMCHNRPGK